MHKEADFKHLAPLLYPDRLVSSEKEDSEVAAKPNREVLAMRPTILRAKVLSASTAKHKGVLFALAAYRDIIAHRPSTELGHTKVEGMLVRDIYPLLTDMAAELGLPRDGLMGGQSTRLAALSAKHQTDVEDRVRLTLEVHLNKWNQLKGVPGFVDKMKLRTGGALQGGKKRVVDCPAYGNAALVSLETEYEIIDGETRPVGTIARALFCYFCKLAVDDEIDLGHLKLL